MGGIKDQIDDYLRNIAINMIRTILSSLYDILNTEVVKITGAVAETPDTWNPSIYNMIRTISQNVILPIAGIIITFILTYELIAMVMEKNNMNDINSGFLYRYLMKACIAVMVLSHTFDITMAIFDVGSYVIKKSGAITASVSQIEMSAALVTLFDSTVEETSTGDLLLITVELIILWILVWGITLAISIVIYLRIIEIYIYISIAPIPYATVANREWGSIGNNYIRGLLALAFQGFFILICVAIYSIMIARLPAAVDLQGALFNTCAVTVVLGFMLFQTGRLSRAIFNAR